MLQENIEKQTKIIEQIASKTNDKNLKQFIKILFSGVPYDELKDFDQEYLFKTASSTFRLVQIRKGDEHKVHVYRPDKTEDQVILEVINADVPFLVDSLSNQLKVEDFDIHLISHPAIAIKRDKEGNFVSISNDEKAKKESVMQFHVTKWCEDDYFVEFIKRIEQILDCVNLAVRDWGSMKNKMEKANELVLEYKFSNDKSIIDETIKFLNWLVEGNFIFLGAYEAKVTDSAVIPIKQELQGVINSVLYHLEEISIDAQYSSDDVLFIRKWDTRSVVHRTAHMDHIIIKKFDSDGKCIYTINFLGFFTSSVYYQSVRKIPLIGKKINNIIARYGYQESSHNCKELVTALEAFPRGELIQMTEDELYETATGIVSLVLMPRVKLFLRKDKAEKFISCLIFIPKARFSTDVRETIEKILCRTFNGFISKQYVNISESQLARLQILVRTQPHSIPEFDIEKLEDDIRNVISVWSDDLYRILQDKYSKKEAKLKYTHYKDAFDIKYTSTFTAKQAVFDISVIEAAILDSTVKFDLYNIGHNDNYELLQLKIYSPDQELALSSTLPILEHLGFYALDVLTFKVALQDLGTNREFYIHHFRLQVKCQNFTLTDQSKQNIEIALDKIWDKGIEDDRFNSLILYCGLTWRQANIIRAYSKYLKQVSFPMLPAYIVDAFTNNSELCKLLIELFELKFDPNNKQTDDPVKELTTKINEKLNSVKSITEDKVIRTFLNVILATKRTNYFITYDSNEFKEYFSFKVASSEVADIPLPKPFAEIFVYSPRVEAVHLRGGKVARGGLRWSDRSEDFRTEVLGLMKAQMTKNAVIVPVGSKGGFVLKKTSSDMTREELFQEGVDCYKTFLSGLLDITDNVLDGKVIPPKSVVRFDEDDPYLVVAADKGTATFSDYANEVSLKYNFWLGDAFASGGSVGYDHKKMGITAKGAWISVERHFTELGIDSKTQPFTVVGIGDMSGDVFGNGMLLSKKIKLVAAFNHMHIFLDPNPDPEKSFEERQRLFNLLRSQWSDYNPTLISKGGGVYNRSEKVIKLNPEIKQLLEITEDEMAPDSLIKAILKAPVDLLWNGGIGTYFKSHTQTNEMIGDKANDSLRVNGRDLRCKAVGEGGNLGFTQLGRIEYARNGGKINTDFIDNSAGVDCSDHEVNIKIAFSDAIRAKKLSLLERNKVLEKMQDEVAVLVLQDNYKQTLIISIEDEGGSKRLDSHAWLMKQLENKRELDREIEFLPLPEQISTLKAEGGKLTRPEISVLVAYAKNSIFSMLSGYDFSKDEFFNNDLFSYFPTILREQFKDYILNHKLKNEIIATVTTNDFVNMLGCCFFHLLLDDTTHKPYDLIKAFVAVREIFDIPKYWKRIETLVDVVPASTKITLLKEIQYLLERNISWFLRHNYSLDNLNEVVAKYKPFVEKLFKGYKSIISEGVISEVESFIEQYKDSNIPIEFLEELAALKATSSACDIVAIAVEAKEDILKVGKIFYLLGEKMHLNWMITQAKRYTSSHYIENIALRSLISEIEDIHMDLTRKEMAIQRDATKILNDNIDACCLIKPSNNEQYNNFISELKASSTDSWVSLLIIAVRRVKELLHA